MINLSVLFANDDVLTQWVMTEVLSEVGFSVVSACRGKEVVELLSDAPAFDILLVDLNLADSCLREIGDIWRRSRPGCPLIYTAASLQALPQPLQCNESFLKAPFSAASLLRVMDAALEDAAFRPIAPIRSQHMHHVH